jgi:hypothetical protein
MASVKFIDRPAFRAKFQESDYAITKIIYHKPYSVKVKQELPFRVKFTTIGVPSYGIGSVPPIGIAVIGFNNYIL